MKKTVWPNEKESLPIGKFNNQRQIVNDSEELKDLYLNEFKERLRIRPSHPDFIAIHKVKEPIFIQNMDKAKAKVTRD